MPLYEYLCEENGREVEIMQSIKDEPFKTWGDLCKAKGIRPGKTPLDSPVKKLLFAHGKHLSWSQWRNLH